MRCASAISDGGSPARRACSRVWIGAQCLLLKGTELGNDCVVAAGSLLHRKFDGDGRLIGGNPARVLRQGVTWRV